MHLTEKSITRLRAPDPSGRQRLYWDSEMTGFGLLVSGKTNKKTFVVQRDLPGGKTRRVTIGPHSSKREARVLTLDAARERAKTVLAVFYDGKDPKAGMRGGSTLRSALDSYLERDALRPKSVELYRYAVERHLSDWLDLPLRSITPVMVGDRHGAIRREVAERGRYGGRCVSNIALQTLRAVWNFAAKSDDTLPANPVERRLTGEWHKLEPRRGRRVREAELPAFHAAVCGLEPLWRDYLLLLLFTGMRRSEAASLTWADVNFAEGYIHVPAPRVKTGSELALPLSDVVRDMLVARRQIGDAKFVFPSNSKSGHITEARVALATVATATKDARPPGGIRLSPHDLRRTFSTIAEGVLGENNMALKALLNHAQPAGGVTAKYVEVTVERLREPAQRVCDKLKALCGVLGPGPGVVSLRG
jgi:integrase